MSADDEHMRQALAGIEQRTLKRSIVATTLVALSGIAFGLYAGSQSIIFDGLFNAIDSVMGLLALVVSRLLARQPGRLFQQGYWHIEPLVLALNGSVLVMLCAYAFVNSLGALMRGGHLLAFDNAMFYAAAIAAASYALYIWQKRLNRTLQSALIALDMQSWLMSTAISSALLLAFAVGYLLDGSAYAHLSPYIDPAILTVLTLVLIPAPLHTVFKALKQVLRITPRELDEEIRALMLQMSKRHGFERFSLSASELGRGLFVEIHILLPAAMAHCTVTELDQVRSEIATAIGRQGPDRWLTIDFTRDGRWL